MSVPMSNLTASTFDSRVWGFEVIACENYAQISEKIEIKLLNFVYFRCHFKFY